MKVRGTLGGLAGACALTLLNQGVRKLDKDAPSLDLLGMNAVARVLKGKSLLTQAAHTIFPVALAGDLVANSLYYGMADSDDKNDTLVRGALLGVAAGLGAIFLPKVLDLDDTATNRTVKTQVMTVAWYVIGGLVAATAINTLSRARVS